MDSLVKRSNGYGAYGSSKPQMSYHRQSTESVTTVVTEINRMTINDKPYYGGGGVQKQACKVEAFDEHDKAYNGTLAVKKHDEYEEEEEYGQVVDADYGAHYGNAGAAVKKQGYSYQQEAYGETGAAGYGGAAMKKQGYNYTKEACGESDAGYGAHHGGAGAAVQTYAYNQQALYGGSHQKDAYGTGYGAVAVVGKEKNGYQYQEAYGGTDAGGYGGAHYGGGGAVQQHGYGGVTAGGKVKQSGYQYQEAAYGGTDAGGYGAHYGGGAAAAIQKHGYRKDVYESETESEDDESDCEEAFPPRGGRMQGGVQVQHGYGADNLGGVRRYESYESREEHGDGRRYESYKSTVQYNGGGHATCSPIKNRHLLGYGA
uniref:Pro-resilin n=1 Tax=Zea mays TaxID=4577 RepID=A0A804QWR2_MAIZE